MVLLIQMGRFAQRAFPGYLVGLNVTAWPRHLAWVQRSGYVGRDHQAAKETRTMSDSFDNTNLYEGLFLLSQSAVGGGLGAALDHVRETLGRIDAEIITLRKWEERKLAYSIKTQKRGMYLISLFRADGTKLTEVENTCNLSELVQRVMITRCDHMGQVEYDAELEAAKTGEAELKLREQKAEQASKPEEAKPEAKAEEAKPDEAKTDEAKTDEAKSDDAAPVAAE